MFLSERFSYEIVRSIAQNGLFFLFPGSCTHGYYYDIFATGAGSNLSGSLAAVHHRHLYVHENGVGVPALEGDHGLFPIIGSLNLQPDCREHA
jgi:hypothetical protein